MKSKQRKIKENRGITLIAVVITIIVLLILTGGIVASLNGNNGILTKTSESKEKTSKSKFNEKVEYATIELKRDFKKVDPINFLEKRFEQAIDNMDGTYLVKDNSYEAIIDIGRREKTQKENFIGKYADINNDGIIDGIIFADLAIGDTGKQWNNSDGQYNVPKINESLKEYIIKESKIDNRWDQYHPKEVVIEKEGTSGNDRFYIMALEDIDNSIHTWYKDAWDIIAEIGKMDDYLTYTSTKFGQGKSNTEKMVARSKEFRGSIPELYKSVGYGNYGNINENDIWFEDNVRNFSVKGWFVPSKEEWSAFANNLGISKNMENTEYYKNHKLRDWYWTSSQCSNSKAWRADFSLNSMYIGDVFLEFAVRLAKTF